jgi:hypothetical protein
MPTSLARDDEHLKSSTREIRDMHRTFYAFFALMAIIGISSAAIESAKNTAYASQRPQSSQIHDCDWEFVKFGGHQEMFADVGGDPTDQRLGAHPIDVDVARDDVARDVSPIATVASTVAPEPIDYAAIDASADPITGEKYGCGIGQPIEPLTTTVTVIDSVKSTDPWENACPVGLPSNYAQSDDTNTNVLDTGNIENDLAEWTQQSSSLENDPYLDWDCGEYLRKLNNSDQRIVGRPASGALISANKSTPAADYTLNNPHTSGEPSDSPRVPLAVQQLQDSFRFEYPEFVLEYLRQFSTAMHELENYAPAHVESKSRIAEEYAAAENAAALAEMQSATQTVAATKSEFPRLPLNQCDRSGPAYNELGYPSCGGYSPNWQQESTFSLATESELASTMQIESVDPIVDTADDRWIGPEAELIDKVDGPFPPLPCDLEIESPEDSNSLASLMRLIVSLDPNLKSSAAGPDLEDGYNSELQNNTVVENGLWSGQDFDFPGCDDTGELTLTQNGWSKEALALDDLQSHEPMDGAQPTWELDPLFAWLGETIHTAWNWGNEAYASLHRHSDDVSAARSTWRETR